MAVLPTNQVVTRFGENENRVDTFVNQNGFYTTNETSPRQVETLPSFMERIDDEFDAKMLTLGYDFSLGNYVAGKVFTAREMVILYSGEYYKVKASTSIPFTTTGTWATDSTSLVAVGDAVLRADLASTSEGDGAAMVAYMPAGTGAVATDVQSKLREFVSVKDFGAVGDGVADDTLAVQNAIAYARTTRRAVWVPNGTYKITSTLDLTGDFYGASLIGESREGTKLKSFVTGTTALIQMIGGSGTATNVHVCDMSLIPNTDYTGVAIRIDGQVLAVCERINIDRFNYGIWLHNNGGGAFSELNTFRDMWVSQCENGIRMEQGGGNDSFHGCTFDNIWMNVTSARNQIGFNHVSGYYYNGHFKLHMWTDGANSQILQHNGNAEQNTGSIQVEAFGTAGFINGTGKWLYEGELLGIGGATINSGYLLGQPLFACQNRISTPATLGYIGNGFLPASMSINALTQPVNRGTGILPTMVAVNGAVGQASVGAVVYNESPANNGFYVFDLGYQQDAHLVRPLWKHGGDGSFGYSYNTSTARGANYAVWASRSPKGGEAAALAYDDGNIRFSRSGYSYSGDAYTHDAGFVIATNTSVRDGAPTDRIWVDGRGIYPDTHNTYSCGAYGYGWSMLHLAPRTVASLPAAGTAGAGARAFVSDAAVTTFASIATGSGVNNVPVYSDGTNWRIG